MHRWSHFGQPPPCASPARLSVIFNYAPRWMSGLARCARTCAHRCVVDTLCELNQMILTLIRLDIRLAIKCTCLRLAHLCEHLYHLNWPYMVEKHEPNAIISSDIRLTKKCAYSIALPLPHGSVVLFRRNQSMDTQDLTTSSPIIFAIRNINNEKKNNVSSQCT